MSEQKSSLSKDLAARGDSRSQRPSNPEFRAFIGSDWGPRPAQLPDEQASAPWAAIRRARLGEKFRGERLVIPAGQLKVRNNDCDYRFRPHSAFAHLSGLGTDQEPDAVLVLNPVTDNTHDDAADGAGATHEATLYFRPRASRTSEEFYADSRYGELWVGVRPSLEEMRAQTAIPTAHIDQLRDALAKDLGQGQVQIRVVPQADSTIETLVSELRQGAGLAEGAAEKDAQLAEALSELRLCKDEWEIEQLQAAVDATGRGFADIIASFPRAIAHARGERVVEGAFGARAREEGNGLGYETIAAAGNHANTLHWIGNHGPVKEGDLILVDAGVEVDSLYTADITRTLPISGKFTEAQAKVYNAVLDAADAAFARAGQAGCKFRDIHQAAMEVIAARLQEWGMLPGTAAESLAPDGQFHRRWMCHGTSHHLGLDVHDCAQARREMYLDATLEPGMCFTIEPGLYFREDDLKVPEEMRGIGVRIEDDIVVNPDGSVRRMSEDIPRTIADIEAWMEKIAKRDR